MKAIQIHETGGPEVLQLAELPIPEPGPGQVLIRVEATGVNFIEIYFRKGVYKAALPMTPGSEAAGTVEKLGPGVTGFAAGDAVASVSVLGSYAEYALVPAMQLVKTPESLSLERSPRRPRPNFRARPAHPRSFCIPSRTSKRRSSA